MLTFLPLEEIEKMESWEGSQLNKAKEILAYELTKLVHGEEEAQKADAAAKALFAGGGDTSNMPSTKLEDADFEDGAINIVTLVHKTGIVASRSEARRAVEQGGITLDGEKIADINAVIAKDRFAGEGLVLKKGKKTFHKITV